MFPHDQRQDGNPVSYTHLGICVAHPGESVVCVTGEGSLQMNIQELQTIRQNRLPVKLFVINNQGYHSIRQTQQSYFAPPLVGVGEESRDLSFPDLEKLAPAYGFTYRAIHHAEELPDVIREVLEMDGAAVCEVYVTTVSYTHLDVYKRQCMRISDITASGGKQSIADSRSAGYRISNTRYAWGILLAGMAAQNSFCLLYTSGMDY